MTTANRQVPARDTNKNRKAGRMWTPSVSLELATRISDGANVVFLMSLIVGLFSTMLIIVMANVKESHWDRERRESNERVAELEKETAEAKRLTKEAELTLERFRAPRRLIGDQRRQITEAMRQFATTRFALSGRTNEQMGFALTIGDSLIDAGWIIKDWPGTATIRPAGRSFLIGTIPTWGLAIHVNDPKESAAGQALVTALRLAGVVDVSIEDANVPVDHPMRHIISIMAGDKQ